MMPASKHGDPQLGVDIHLCMVPPSPSPVPLPTPHLSIVFDPFDYVPFLGATVTVCGMKRATAGTNGIVVHIPPGFPFAPKLPEKDDELFMGSSSVVADGDPFSYIALPVLSCQVAGMINPFRLRKKGIKIGVLPLTFNLAIPTSVFLGGAPTISLAGLAMKGVFAGLGKLARMGVFKRLRQKLFKNIKPGFLKCIILRAEPVNILNGEVSVEQQDFTLPGRLPIEWVRSYGSSSEHVGVCGRGWQTLLDLRLEVDEHDGTVQMHGPQVGPLWFERLPVTEGDAGTEFELADGARLTRHGDGYCVSTKDDRLYHFAKRPRAEHAAPRHWSIVRITDRCGNALEFEYDVDGLPHSLVDASGRRLALDFVDGRLAAVTLNDSANRFTHGFVRYVYDDAGQLVAVIDALSHAYRFAYEAGHMVRHTDRNGLSFHYAYEASPSGDPRVVHAWGDGGLHAYRFEYLDALNERRITDSLGHVSLVKLDERGLPISEIDPLGGRTVYEYDEAGRTTAVVDPDGRRTAYDYDDRGNLITLMQPDGAALQILYDASDKPETITEPGSATRRYQWDGRGLLEAEISPLGATTLYRYDGRGQLVSHVNPRGAQTVIGYDGDGNVNRWAEPGEGPSLFAHDALGNLMSKVDPLDRHTRYRHDANSRLTDIETPAGHSVHCDYDGEGNIVLFVDENGARTAFVYCGLGEIARRIQPDGQTVEYRYDTEERLVGVVNPRGELCELRRDALGRVIEDVDYWGRVRSFRYSPAGQLIETLDPMHRFVRYERDPMGRLLGRTFDAGDGTADTERFVYNGAGHLTMAENRHVKLVRDVDIEGKLLAETHHHVGGPVVTLKSGHDAAGNRTRRDTEIDGRPVHAVEFAYDAADRHVRTSIDGRTFVGVERDAAGQAVAVARRDGLQLRRRYDAEGQLVQQALVAADGDRSFGTHYTYDPAGNLTRREDHRFGVDLYRHDPMGRIVEHIDPAGRLRHLDCDAAGDMLQTRAMTEDEGALPAAPGDGGWVRVGHHGGAQYRFDSSGNLVTRIGPEDRVELSWDADQRLVTSRRTTRDGRDPDVVTTYRYDPLGRRIAKQSGQGRTLFGWDGETLALEIADKATREFVHEPESFVPLAMLTADQALLFVNDPNGCPVRLLAPDGKTVWSASLSPWGETLTQHAATVDNPIRLQGQYFDAETGLAYNRYRYFDARIGQFISQDPIGLDGGYGFYAYAPNALVWLDPWGLACIANKVAGTAREKRLGAKLDAVFGSKNVLRERLLRDAQGKTVKDAVTGEARRVDFVVLGKDGMGTAVEATSRTAPKTAQLAKEARIRSQGGLFVRDPKTKQLVEVRGLSRVIRME